MIRHLPQDLLQFEGLRSCIRRRKYLVFITIIYRPQHAGAVTGRPEDSLQQIGYCRLAVSSRNANETEFRRGMPIKIFAQDA